MTTIRHVLGYVAFSLMLLAAVAALSIIELWPERRPRPK